MAFKDCVRGESILILKSALPVDDVFRSLSTGETSGDFPVLLLTLMTTS